MCSCLISHQQVSCWGTCINYLWYLAKAAPLPCPLQALAGAATSSLTARCSHHKEAVSHFYCTGHSSSEPTSWSCLHAHVSGCSTPLLHWLQSLVLILSALHPMTEHLSLLEGDWVSWRTLVTGRVTTTIISSFPVTFLPLANFSVTPSLLCHMPQTA